MRPIPAPRRPPWRVIRTQPVRLLGFPVSKSYVIQTTDQRERLVSFLAKREVPFQVEYGPVRKQRTLPQNARLWALHQLASKETGYAPDELHELMLCKFFGSQEIELKNLHSI